MQIGVAYPQNELRGDPTAVWRIGRAVEDLGFDHLLAYDHVLGAVHADRTPELAGPYTEHDPFHDPFVMFAYLAGITERIGFATGILILPQRQTALVARQAADVDLLSGGRLRLGVGVGWNRVEYEALGMRFTDRGKRIEEQIAVLRALFTEEIVDFTGRWHRIDRAGLNPMPVQRPIPIWMGGGWNARERTIIEPAVRRIAAIADGWFTHLPPNEDGRAGMETFQRFVEEAGRDPAKLPVEGRIPAAKNGPEEWKRGIDAFQRMGMTSVELTTMGAGFRTLDEHLDALRRFRELV